MESTTLHGAKGEATKAVSDRAKNLSRRGDPRLGRRPDQAQATRRRKRAPSVAKPPAPPDPQYPNRFPPGRNVNPLSARGRSGVVFRRGPDMISRGSIKLLLGQVQLDKRQAL